ncbi:hypothetical protein PFISCL1PPCAC_15471 [Pristionchus fissidentatus]|uniref:Reverse transcriptase domain-containing protein n=1 Tax=Pristionchus fissidentatus TaxID=1538716 RepID=A0AAV5W2M6_9BILA|nr:hypothetical protein PFISCL1PPCAC_15471 [Pristionchus fissidentatus]
MSLLKCGHSPGSDGILPENLTHLEYADDVAHIAKSRPELERMLKKLMDACSRVGLEVNASKTNLLTSCTTTRAPITNRKPIYINGMSFEYKKGTKYLGSWLSLPLDHENEIKRRVQCGWLAWRNIGYLLNHPTISKEIRMRTFNACILPTVLYGCEAWTLRSSDKEDLAIAQRKMERKMLRLTWEDKLTNERLRQATGVIDWVEEATRKKLK